MKGHDFKDAKFRNLSKAYERNRNEIQPAVFRRMNSTLNFLKKALGTNAEVIREKSDLVTIYLLASYVLQNFVIAGKESKFSNFVVDFLERVENPDESDKEGYYSYWVARTSSPDSKKNIGERFEIILRHFLEYVPNIKPKDMQREFDWGQRLAIYARALREASKKHKKEASCAICGRPTPFTKGEADHIKPYRRGGLTIVKNGQWTCIKDNRAKGG